MHRVSLKITRLSCYTYMTNVKRRKIYIDIWKHDEKNRKRHEKKKNPPMESNIADYDSVSHSQYKHRNTGRNALKFWVKERKKYHATIYNNILRKNKIILTIRCGIGACRIQKYPTMHRSWERFDGGWWGGRIYFVSLKYLRNVHKWWIATPCSWVLW